MIEQAYVTHRTYSVRMRHMPVFDGWSRLKFKYLLPYALPVRNPVYTTAYTEYVRTVGRDYACARI